MNRHTIRQHFANASTALAIVRNKMDFIQPQGVYGDLDALSIFTTGALKEAERLVDELRLARDTADQLQMAEQDAANRVADTAHALDVIGEALANYRPEPRENVLTHPAIRSRPELVVSNDGTV